MPENRMIDIECPWCEGTFRLIEHETVRVTHFGCSENPEPTIAAIQIICPYCGHTEEVE